MNFTTKHASLLFTLLATCLSVSSDASAATPVSIPEFAKMCFGDRHPRCFELKNFDYAQSTRYGLEGPIKIDPSEKARLWKAMSDYRGWVKSELANQKLKPLTCTDAVKFEITNVKEELCLDGISKKAADAKAKALLTILGRPKAASSVKR